jgi:DNA modification methylase
MIEPYYQKDGITIYHGDCAEVLPELGRFDLLLTDPPYGLGERICSDWMGTTKKDIDWDLKPCQESIANALHACAVAIVWGGNYFCNLMPPARCVLVWDKMNGTNDMADCEIALTTLDVNAQCFSRHHFSKGIGGKVHPTQKPLPLMRWCLTLVPKANHVLDPFMGSGTTLVAAKLEGRSATGIELSEEYCEKAANRLAQGVLDFSGAN